MPITRSLREFILNMPKVELHLHIEGSLEPELAFTLAARNGVTLKRKDGTAYEIVAALRAAYQFANLQEFLDIYYQGMSVLLTEQDFYDLTMAYLQKIASQQVRHTEIFFDPQGHTERGVAFATAINGIHRALQDGRATLGISSRLIMCFLRHLPEAEAFATLEQARPYIEQGWIHGIGLDSSERGFPPTNFANVYAAVREQYPQLKRVAHAGEEGPAEYVRQALDVLHIHRIDHGNHALDDDALIERLVQEKIGLTMCPLSNLRLCHTLDFEVDTKLTDLRQHTLKQMLMRGVKATVNSDDPSYFGGYITENYLAIAEALNLTQEDIIQLVENAIEVSFLDEAAKTTLRAALSAYSSAPRIWVLTDDKPGNSTQSLGVAAHFPYPFEEKKITLNKAAKLPNRILGRTRISAATHQLTPPWPDIAIAAGRRLVPLLRYIKKQNPACFITYLMRPETSLKSFDLVAIPAHDAPKPAPNVLQTIGAPHRVTPELLAEAAAEWREKLAPLPTPRIAVLAGGDSRSAQFTAQDFHELGMLASEMAASLNGSLMVSTSRRTSKKQADYLRLALTAESEFFAWEAHAPNPYHAFLGLAEIIIVTGDSMSMCAEACGTGKPVYIYVPRQGSLAPKLRHLHESLIEKGLARYLTANPETDWQPTAPLNEAKRVAMEMMGRRSLLT